MQGIRIITLLIILAVPVTAAQNKFRKIKSSPKETITSFDIGIPRTNFDIKMDRLIANKLGDRYRRANVYDFYPLEVSNAKFRSHKYKVKMMDYYNYARADLEKMSRSKLLKVIKLDFDGDGNRDFAIIVRDTKKRKNCLAILNKHEKLYLETFAGTYLEPMNNGSYPTTVVYGDEKRKTVKSPSIRMVAFDDEDELLYFDRSKERWLTLGLD